MPYRRAGVSLLLRASTCPGAITLRASPTCQSSSLIILFWRDMNLQARLRCGARADSQLPTIILPTCILLFGCMFARLSVWIFYRLRGASDYSHLYRVPAFRDGTAVPRCELLTFEKRNTT